MLGDIEFERLVSPWDCENEMSLHKMLSPDELKQLSAYDSCTVSNAIERLNVRMRNEGFSSGRLHCRTPEFAPMAGYAATARIRTAEPPIAHRCYYDRMDWWEYVASLPEPRIIVIEDADEHPGKGAFVGEIHANIGQALACIGCVTNGAVRDVPSIAKLGLHLFSGFLSVSHAYAHIIEFGEPVKVAGLKVESGDLMHGDLHGILTIPLSVAAEVPAQAAKILAEERELIEFCRSPHFSLQELSVRLENSSVNCDLPWSPR